MILTYGYIRQQQAPGVPSKQQVKFFRRAGVQVSLEQFSLGINQYQTFCRTRGLSLEPSTETLASFVIYVGQRKGVSVVKSSLDAICLAFEHVYPNIRDQCRSKVVERTIREMWRT
jgi:hypothetical protein